MDSRPRTHAPTQPHTLHLGLSVFLITFALYAALVPWMVRVWARTGDEPHYLLAAHSLAFDGDFDLGNNYDRRDYHAFYTESYLNPHVLGGPRGQSALTHNLGLSLLIAPAYRLGGLAGVEYFLAALGAVLAANVFLLGHQLTHNWLAAAVGWISVSFTPPVVWYVFLVYPEMVAGLCTLIALRYLLEDHHSTHTHTPTHLILVPFVIALLPWLSSRYLPVFGVLVAWAAWRAWHERSRSWLFAGLGGLAGLGAYMLFSLWLYGQASPAASYAGPTPLGVEESFALVRFARGILGWLLDNQRGLLVSAPIFIAASWGIALLLQHKAVAGVAVLLPLAAALIPVAVWGGFWVGWEYSARFLVAGLPALGGGVAYLWAAGRRAVVVALTLTLLGPSLLVGRAVILHPLKGIISSPIEMLKPHLDLEALIPAMGRYAFVTAGSEAVVGGPYSEGSSSPGELRWKVAAGSSGIALRQVDMPEFPFGWYSARLPIAASGAAPDTPVAAIKVFSPQGGDYFAQTVYGRDLSGGRGSVFNFAFQSPLYNGWGFPPTVLVSATGQADLWLGTLVIEPERFHSLVLPTLWLGALALAGFAVTLGARPPRPLLASPPNLPVNLALALVALGSLGWSLRPQPRTFRTVDLQRTVGTVVEDALAFRGRAMEARPEAGQEAGRLATTLPEIYAPGRYRLTVSVSARAADAVHDPNLSVAGVRVLASDTESLARRWDVTAAQLPPDGQYHRFAFEFENPRQQALTFILDYPAVIGLRADVLMVEPLS